MPKPKPPPENLPVYLTRRQTAELLNIGDTLLSELVATGQLRAYRLGPRAIRFRLADVEALLVPVPVKVSK